MVSRSAPPIPRILVVDPLSDRSAVERIAEVARIGLAPTVNLRRVTDPVLRAEIGRRWPVVDLDGFRAERLVAAVEQADGFDALTCRAGIPLTRAVLERVSADTLEQPLRLVVRAASGLDNVDLPAASDRGVTVRATPGANAEAVAELTIALMLDALRGIGRRSAALRSGDWAAATANIPTGSLAGARVGLVGSGNIAREVAIRLVAFGADIRVLGSPRFTAEAAAHWPARRAESLRELLTWCDIVSVHVPATPETSGLLGPTELRWMRTGSMLVNTSRAAIVPEDGLDAALRDPDRGPSFAAVDVFASEGTGFESILTNNPWVTLSPHVAGMTRNAMATAATRQHAEITRFYRVSD